MLSFPVPADWAIEGIVSDIREYEARGMWEDGDAVLCRCNAPLVGPAFDLIRQGKKAVILGRDIGKNLLALVEKVERKYKVHQLDDILVFLSEYAQEQISRFMRRKQSGRAQLLEDKVLTIQALAEECGAKWELEQRITQVFSDEREGVTFSSVHKFKGEESKRVFILKPELMPHPKATSPEDLEQEGHIKYVSITRSKEELYWVR